MMKPATPNRCASCLAKAAVALPSWECADTGLCGECGRVAEVFDMELLDVYRKGGIGSRVIYVAFPRLRVRAAGEPPAFTLDEARRWVRDWR